MSTITVNQEAKKLTKTFEGKRDVKLVFLKDIHVEPGHNPRLDYGDMEAMAESFRQFKERVEAGAASLFELTPIRAHYSHKINGYIVTNGHRSLLAAQMAGYDKFPILPFSSDKLERLYANFDMNSGLPFNEVERAIGIKKIWDEITMRAKEKGEKINKANFIKEMCTRLNISQPTYYNNMKLLDAPQDVQDAIVNKEVSSVQVNRLLAQGVEGDELSKVVQKAIQKKTEEVGANSQESDSTKPQRSRKATAADFATAFRQLTLKKRLDEISAHLETTTDEKYEPIKQFLSLLVEKHDTLEEFVNDLNRVIKL